MKIFCSTSRSIGFCKSWNVAEPRIDAVDVVPRHKYERNTAHAQDLSYGVNQAIAEIDVKDGGVEMTFAAPRPGASDAVLNGPIT